MTQKCKSLVKFYVNGKKKKFRSSCSFLAIMDNKLEFLKVNLSEESAYFSMVAWHVSNLAWNQKIEHFRLKYIN